MIAAFQRCMSQLLKQLRLRLSKSIFSGYQNIFLELRYLSLRCDRRQHFDSYSPKNRCLYSSNFGERGCAGHLDNGVAA
jgi:hypothetical protein